MNFVLSGPHETNTVSRNDPGIEVPPQGNAGQEPSRPASLWPDSTRAPGAEGSAFTPTRFDPLAEERSRMASLGAASFDVCHPALALRAVLLVQAVLALVALVHAGDVAQWLGRQATLAFGGAMATGLWLVVLCVMRRPLQSMPVAGRATVVLGLGAAVAALTWGPLAWAGLVQGGALQLLAVTLGGMAIAGLLWAWLDLRARIWQPANANARLAELQSRIRPHFLFNALNTALALVRVDPAKAETVLEDLAQLFRVALAEVGTSVTLDDEIDLARRYLAIEQVRFGSRLAVTWDLDVTAGAARVPPLVLQPLVENAVRHGIEPAPNGGQVTVTTQRQRGQVVVTVSNTLAAPEEGVANPGHGMALHNVRERLRLLHDVAAQCDVWKETSSQPGRSDRFLARIVLPTP
jgi:two-component system sensor histidine kinase AlgZ